MRFATPGWFPHCTCDCKCCWWMNCRWNLIVFCNFRIVPAMKMAISCLVGSCHLVTFLDGVSQNCFVLQMFNMHFGRKSRTRCVFERLQTREMLCFCSIQRAAPNLASQALRNDGCGTASRHARIRFKNRTYATRWQDSLHCVDQMDVVSRRRIGCTLGLRCVAVNHR